MSTVTTIKRGGLTAAIDSMGAQLTSLALNGNEYLWQGDPAFWGKHAPILFPHAGRVVDGLIEAKGEVYQAKPHVCGWHLRDAAPRPRAHRRA